MHHIRLCASFFRTNAQCYSLTDYANATSQLTSTSAAIHARSPRNESPRRTIAEFQLQLRNCLPCGPRVTCQGQSRVSAISPSTSTLYRRAKRHKTLPTISSARATLGLCHVSRGLSRDISTPRKNLHDRATSRNSQLVGSMRSAMQPTSALRCSVKYTKRALYTRVRAPRS